MEHMWKRENCFIPACRRTRRIPGMQGCDTMAKMNDTSKNPQEERMRRIEETLARIRHTIVIMSGKGGVGKTTVASNLAFALSLRGYQVGLLDADIHGPNIPKMLGIEDQQLLSTEEGILPAAAPPRSILL